MISRAMSSGRRRRGDCIIWDELGVKYAHILVEVGLRAAHDIPLRYVSMLIVTDADALSLDVDPPRRPHDISRSTGSEDE